MNKNARNLDIFWTQATLEEIRQAASRICRDYLNGRWKSVSADQLVVKRISSGLSNFLYYVSLPKSEKDKEHTAYQSLKVQEEGKFKLVAGLQAAADGENRNESHYNELLAAMGDLNGNNRKRYHSASSVSSTVPSQNEPEEVLLRIYGQSHGEDALEAVITESVVFALLSERNFGPKLHGIFPGGRIEQYIPARALLTGELANPKISVKIAEKMGEIHSLNIPMSKEPNWIWNCMHRWQRNLPAIFARSDWNENQIYADYMRSINYGAEVQWIKSVVDKGQHQVLFCHNDLQEGNILLRSSSNIEDTNSNNSLNSATSGDEDVLENKRSKILNLDDDSVLSASDFAEPDLMIIDFEYCAYNYRGFDLANHFIEWTIDYTNPTFPFFYHHEHQCPNAEQRRLFIKTYLKKLNESENYWEPSPREIDDVENEIKVFKMFSHLFWSLWSVVNVTSNIEFGYWDYAAFRIKEYFKLKERFIAGNAAQI